jgi:Calcineurin-like phosphoesterase superfamily domain
VRVLEQASIALHVGDVTAAAVLEELRAVVPVEAVHGNMDEPDLKAALPERAVVEAEGLGSGWSTIQAPRRVATTGSSNGSPAATSSPTATRTFRRSLGTATSGS